MAHATPARLISADSHVFVNLDAIRERIPSSLRAPFDAALAEQARIEDKQRRGRKLERNSWDMEAMRDPGYHDPAARLAAMDRDGVEAELLYADVNTFSSFRLVRDDWRPISRALIDYLAEFAARDPKRLKVAFPIPIIDVGYACEEVKRLAAQGARSVQLPNYPSELGLPDYHDPVYAPLFGLLEEAGISISHHLSVKTTLYDVFRRDPTPQAAIFTSMPAIALSEVLAWWILTGTLERFPRLRIVLGEPQLYWIPGFLAYLDRKADGRYRLPGLRLKPSEYFRRNMACTFMDDLVGLELRHKVGLENILWSTDFPHPATTWPNSRETIARQFAGIPDSERDLICAGNAARLYGF